MMLRSTTALRNELAAIVRVNGPKLACYSTSAAQVEEVVIDEEKALQDEKVKSFESYPISDRTKEALNREGISSLFPIQSACFNHIYEGKDLIARARTGTGKTLSFGLPMVERLLKEKVSRSRAPSGLILCPTRELAVQVTKELIKFQSGLRIVTIYGGASMMTQRNELRNGTHIVVGTPGRVNAFIEDGSLDCSEIKTCTFDEADRMLDIGFEKELDNICNAFKRNEHHVQMTMFSATVPAWVKKTAQKYMASNHAFVDLVGTSALQTSETVTHLALRANSSCFIPITVDLLRQYNVPRAIIFVERKIEASRIADAIPHAAAIHGDISQNLRERALERFKTGQVKVLVATDVAARGIDIPEVGLVIQHEVPQQETYVHRSGRTGRAGKFGTCITFFQNKSDIDEISRHIKVKIPVIAPPNPQNDVEHMIKNTTAAFNKVNPSQIKPFLKYAEELVNTMGGKEAVARALAMSSASQNSGAKWRSSLTGIVNQQTWQTPMSREETSKFLNSLNLSSRASVIETDDRACLFDVSANDEDVVLKGLEDKGVTASIVSGVLPSIQRFPGSRPVGARDNSRYGFSTNRSSGHGRSHNTHHSQGWKSHRGGSYNSSGGSYNSSGGSYNNGGSSYVGGNRGGSSYGGNRGGNMGQRSGSYGQERGGHRGGNDRGRPSSNGGDFEWEKWL